VLASTVRSRNSAVSASVTWPVATRPRRICSTVRRTQSPEGATAQQRRVHFAALAEHMEPQKASPGPDA
jgi:hypothetical protein